ncbi:MAG TPA: sensor histidine kinase, partial [Thermodesulfobacteriota bacterium]|nr:sensor histidine kinase [Thermodesulfobacteriota bacterium]
QDISERKKAEESLKNSLAEKIALLKEVHHRVKNNLQIIASLLSLQAGHTTSREVADILSDTRSRVRSMALLHEMLYQSGTLASINFKAYGKELCTQLLRSCSPAGARITVEVKMAPLALGLEQAVPCGLILSELVSNALKHGFSHKRTGTIEVSLEKEDQMLFLSVKDDGEGLPIDFDPAQTGTLGLKLVSNLAAQLGGRLNIKGPEVKGSVFEVIFPG